MVGQITSLQMTSEFPTRCCGYAYFMNWPAILMLTVSGVLRMF
jgi:hypothetical protein